MWYVHAWYNMLHLEWQFIKSCNEICIVSSKKVMGLTINLASWENGSVLPPVEQHISLSPSSLPLPFSLSLLPLPSPSLSPSLPLPERGRGEGRGGEGEGRGEGGRKREGRGEGKGRGRGGGGGGPLPSPSSLLPSALSLQPPSSVPCNSHVSHSPKLCPL